MIYKQCLTIEKIIVKTRVPREFHPPCRKLETFRQKKEKFQLFVPVWGGIFCSMALECPGEAALLHMGLPRSKVYIRHGQTGQLFSTPGWPTCILVRKSGQAMGVQTFSKQTKTFFFVSPLVVPNASKHIMAAESKAKGLYLRKLFLLQAQCCTDQVYKASSSELTTCKIQIREGCVQRNCCGDRGHMSKHFARVTRPIWISEYENGKGHEVLSEKKYCKGNRIAHHKPRPNLILTQWVWDNPSVKTFSQRQWFYIDRITE